MNDVFGSNFRLSTWEMQRRYYHIYKYFQDEPLKVSYLFRTFDDMSLLEQTALNMVKGTISDIGCGAGSHSLFLQEKGFEIKLLISLQKLLHVVAKEV